MSLNVFDTLIDRQSPPGDVARPRPTQRFEPRRVVPGLPNLGVGREHTSHKARTHHRTALNYMPLNDRGIFGTHGMKVLTDDPDWAPKLYEARALAIMFVRKHGRASSSGKYFQAVRDGLTITYHPSRSPVLLTIDAPGQSVERCSRVLALEWNDGDAWRLAIETYHHGRWESRLKVMVHPRPWLERWRALATFTGSLPREQIGVSRS